MSRACVCAGVTTDIAQEWPDLCAALGVEASTASADAAEAAPAGQGQPAGAAARRGDDGWDHDAVEAAAEAAAAAEVRLLIDCARPPCRTPCCCCRRPPPLPVRRRWPRLLSLGLARPPDMEQGSQQRGGAEEEEEEEPQLEVVAVGLVRSPSLGFGMTIADDGSITGLVGHPDGRAGPAEEAGVGQVLGGRIVAVNGVEVSDADEVRGARPWASDGASRPPRVSILESVHID
jgi:hypothetical protein